MDGLSTLVGRDFPSDTKASVTYLFVAGTQCTHTFSNQVFISSPGCALSYDYSSPHAFRIRRSACCTTVGGCTVRKQTAHEKPYVFHHKPFTLAIARMASGRFTPRFPHSIPNHLHQEQTLVLAADDMEPPQPSESVRFTLDITSSYCTIAPAVKSRFSLVSTHTNHAPRTPRPSLLLDMSCVNFVIPSHH